MQDTVAKVHVYVRTAYKLTVHKLLPSMTYMPHYDKQHKDTDAQYNAVTVVVLSLACMTYSILHIIIACNNYCLVYCAKLKLGNKSTTYTDSHKLSLQVFQR